MSQLEDLPNELIYIIFYYLTGYELSIISQTNRHFNCLSLDDDLWERLVKNIYGQDITKLHYSHDVNITWFDVYKLAHTRTINFIHREPTVNYSINYNSAPYSYKIPNDIKEIIWFHYCDTEKAQCMCGEDVYGIISMKDNNYAFIKFWSGCLTYDKNDAPSFIYYSNSFDDLYNFCMDNESRTLYDYCTNN